MRFQWHYILGEIILLFVGVTLAIGFNNWNTTVKVAQEREEALQRIQQELQENLQQLVQARADNQAVIAALNDYYGEPTGPEPTIHQLRALQKKHPVVEAAIDSIATGQETYRYTIKAGIFLELPELTQIAWQTTQTLGVVRTFQYECLYELEKVYNLQRSYQDIVDKAVEALQRKDMHELTNIVNFSRQFDQTLESHYQNALATIEACQ